MVKYTNVIKPNIYRIGLYLSILYVLFGFIANGDILPLFLQKIALYGLVGFGIIVIIVEIKSGESPITRYSLWYALVLWLSCFTLPYSNRGELLPSNLYTMIVCFLLTFIIGKFIRSKRDFLEYCWGNVITALIMIVLVFLSGGLVGTRLDRLGDDICGNANVFAMGLMYPCMLAVWMLIFGEYSKRINIFLILTILLDMYAITLSAGRKSFILPFVFLYLLLIFKKGEENRSHFVKYSIYIVVIVIVVYYLIHSMPILYNSIGIRMEQMTNAITGNGLVDNSTRVRSDFRRLAIEGWVDSPIWGNGFDSFKSFAGAITGIYAYSHCNQTELLFCGGIILFIAYYGGFLYVYIKACNPDVPNAFSAFAKAAVIAEFIFDIGLVAYNVFFVQNFLMLSFVIVCGIYDDGSPSHHNTQLSEEVNT